MTTTLLLPDTLGSGRDYRPHGPRCLRIHVPEFSAPGGEARPQCPCDRPQWFRPPNSAAHPSFRIQAGRWKADLHQGPRVGLAVDAKGRTVDFGKRAGEGKSKVGAAGTEAGRCRKLAERLDCGRDLFLAHAKAAVTHAQHHFAAVRERG